MSSLPYLRHQTRDSRFICVFCNMLANHLGKLEPLGQQLLTKGEKQVRLFHDGAGLRRVMGTRQRVLHDSPSPRKNRMFLETLLLSFLSSTNCRDFWACDLQNSGFSSSTARVHRQKVMFTFFKISTKCDNTGGKTANVEV